LYDRRAGPRTAKRRKAPAAECLILAYTRADVAELNELVRAWRREHGELKRGQIIETERGAKEFAAGDRLYFLRSERSLGVKNGSLGTIEKICDRVLEVKLDATGDRVAVDTKCVFHATPGQDFT
jgi:ATP-dependent exoDNAse (exonuclease V) alpha subunit